MIRAVNGLIVKVSAAHAGFVMACVKDQRLSRLGLMILVLGLLTLTCRPLLLLIFPGILMIYLPWWRQRFLSDVVVFGVGTSIAFWIVTFWFLPYGKIPLSFWAYGVLVVATTLLGVGLWKWPERDRVVIDQDDRFAVILLAVAAALRFSFVWRWPLAPAGADMSMHSYMAALIAAGDTVPSSHLPLLPIDSFGAYPAGFQALTALMSMLGGIPIYRGAMFMEASTLAFLTLAFYGFVRVFWDQPSSAMVALLVTFLPRNPQHFIQWGGDPTLLALGLLVMSLAFRPWLEEQMSPGMWCLCALMVAASVFTHLIPVIGYCYAMLPVGVYVVIGRWHTQRNALKRVMWNLSAIGLVSGLLVGVCLPSLLSTEVSPGEIEWVRHFQQRGAGGAWGGTIGNAIVTIPPYLTQKIFGAPYVMLSVLGLFVLAYRRPHLALASGICVLTVVGLVINSMYWLLPLSYAIYPERVALLLLLPSALGIGALLDGVRRWGPKPEVLVWIMAALVLYVAVRGNEHLLYKGLVPNNLLTKADLLAMHWIQENTKPGATFHNRYGDAGLWIPAIAFRPITDPHLSPFFFEEFRAASSELKAQYVYVGKRKLLGEPIALGEFESAPNRYRKVYDQDGVMIYEVIDHAANRGGLGPGLAERWHWENHEL
jgi:hypothetical protein